MLLVFVLAASFSTSPAPDTVSISLLPKELMSRARISVDEVRREASMQLIIRDRGQINAVAKRLEGGVCRLPPAGVDVRAIVEITRSGVTERYVADRYKIYGETLFSPISCASDWLWEGGSYFKY